MSTVGRADVRRRRIVLGAIVGVVAVAGLTWRRQEQSAARDAASRFWTLRFDSPNADGPALDTSSFSGQPLLVNFWATWCSPCMEELPLLSRFYTENSANGWQQLGLAIDKPSSVRRLLARSPLSYPIAMAQDEGDELIEQLGDTERMIPFSVLFGADGKLFDSHVGEIYPDDLANWRKLV